MSARRLLRHLKRLRRSTSGLALTEFALAMPVLLTAGLWGVETANFAVVNMRVSQLAIHLADNASRIGDTSTLENRKIYEADINDLLRGAFIQGGRLDVFENGRAIISSLEVVPDSDGDQYIHWQRCMGKRTWASSYGVEGDGADGSMAGMGPAGREVMAFEGEAVIFVELVYEYQPLVSEMFIGKSDIHSIASFTVRDSRDLSGIYQRIPANPDPVAGCATFDNPYGRFSGGSGTGGGGGSGGSTTTSTGGSTTSSSTGGSTTTSGSSGGSTTTSGGTTGGSTTTSGGTTGGSTTSTSTTSGGSSTTSTGGSTSTSTSSGGSTTTTSSTTSGGGGGGRGGGGGGGGGGRGGGRG